MYEVEAVKLTGGPADGLVTECFKDSNRIEVPYLNTIMPHVKRRWLKYVYQRSKQADCFQFVGRSKE